MVRLNDEHTEIRGQPLLAGRFTIIRMIGKGAAGRVYHAIDREQGGIEVALKVLHNLKAFDDHTLKRFLNEMRVCQEIEHPNIIRAFDLITADDLVAFSMEYVEGQDLSKIFKDKSLISYERIIEIVIQLAEALNELHSRAILHRDIKLENLLVRKDGVVKLTDLGLMKQTHAQGITATGILLGTAQYLPPEYVINGVYDVRSEIYTVGLLVYELVTRQRRLSNKPGLAAIEHLMQTDFVLPPISNSDVPELLLRLVDICANRQPRKRFQSARELLEFLNKEVSSQLPWMNHQQDRDRKIQLPPPTVLYPDITVSKKNADSKALIYGMMIALSIILFGLVVGHLYSKEVPPLVLAEGNYRGKIQLFGTKYQKNINISIKNNDISFVAGLPGCEFGVIDIISGAMACSKTGYFLKVIEDKNGEVLGEIVNKDRKERHIVTFNKIN